MKNMNKAPRQLGVNGSARPVISSKEHFSKILRDIRAKLNGLEPEPSSCDACVGR